DTGDLSADLRTVFSASHRALDAETARAFGLLALAPGADLGLPAAAALLGLPLSRARALLRRLQGAHLVTEPDPGRYRMHDLIRLYAAERGAELPAGERESALRRLVDFCLHTAFRADQLLEPYPLPFEAGEPAEGCAPLELTDAEEALAWFDAEYEGLLATQRAAQRLGWHATTWRLAWAVDTYQWRRGHVHDHLTIWRTALLSTERLGDRTARALAHRRLGNALLGSGDVDAAVRHLERSLELIDKPGDPRNEGHSHQSLARAQELRGDLVRALDHATRALDLFHGCGDPVREGDALNTVGWYKARLGRYDEARRDCERALALFQGAEHGYGRATTLDSLGYIAQSTGDLTGAADYYRRSLALNLDVLGDAYDAADTLVRLAETHQARGLGAEADDVLRHALELYLAQRRAPEADDVRARLAP
ncbi:tetratricopeptide repeat protein, partial [Streptomyces sp. SBT349]|uniref:tetratricopeptide repeat protein n=1 Tax=Streptomyces sp. SBT349 TaxID=1580539 RepID=UPI00066B0237